MVPEDYTLDQVGEVLVPDRVVSVAAVVPGQVVPEIVPLPVAAAVPTDFVEVGLGPVSVVIVSTEAADFLCEGMVGRFLGPVVRNHVGIHHNSAEDIFVAVVLAALEVG